MINPLGDNSIQQATKLADPNQFNSNQPPAIDPLSVAKSLGGNVAETPAPGTTTPVDPEAFAKSLGGQVGGGSPTPTPTPAPAPSKNVFQKIAGFLGMEKFGQGISTIGSNIPDEQLKQAAQTTQEVSQLLKLAHSTTDPVKRGQLLNLVKSYGIAPSAGDINPGFDLSNKEVLGSAAQTALNITGAGSLEGSGAEQLAKVAPGLAETVAPALETATKVIGKVAAPIANAGTIGKIFNAGLKGAEIGAMYGEAQGLQNNEDIKGQFGSVVTNALFNGIVSGGIQTASELMKYLSSANVTEALYNKALGISKNTELAGRSPSADLIEQGKISSKQGFADWANEQIGTLGKSIHDTLDSVTTPVTPNNVIEQIRSELTDKYGDTLGGAGIQKLMDDLPIAKLRDIGEGTMSMQDLNSLRSQIDNKFIGNSKWLSVNMDPVKIDSYKTAANVMRGIVQGSDETLPGMFDQLSDAYTTRNSVEADLAKPHILTNLFQILGALGVGGTELMHGGGLPAAAAVAATFGAEKAATSAPVQTAAAVALDRFNNWLTSNGASKQVVDTVGRVVGRNLIQKFVNSLSGYGQATPASPTNPNPDSTVTP